MIKPINRFIPITLLTLLVATGSARAQPVKDTIFSNALKINVAAGFLRNVSLFYERNFSTGGIRGLSVAPEVRYHFNICDCGRHTGLYAGIYSKLTWLYGDLVFKYWNETRYIDVGGAGDLKELGFGLQLGYQFVLWKRMVVDLFFMGPRTSFQKLTMNVDSDFADEVIPQIEEELNRRLEALGLDPVEIPVSPEFTLDFRFNNFRYGIGIG
ncbi:MAG: hypothetical protein P8100_16440, partial [bacterium]